MYTLVCINRNQQEEMNRYTISFLHTRLINNFFKILVYFYTLIVYYRLMQQCPKD
jgi:uncharacterized membrane protein